MALNQPVPQTNRMTQTMTQGVIDARTSRGVARTVGTAGGGGMVAVDSSRVRSAGDSQSCRGCQTLRKPIRQAIEISDAPMSTIHGLTKLEIRYCGMAKDAPQTR